MYETQQALFVALGAVMGGLILFATLLLAGLSIVRRLRLPQDVPEAIFFEPLAPTIRQPTQRADAEAIAAQRQAVVTLLNRAHSAVSNGMFCQETLVTIDTFSEKNNPTYAKDIEIIRHACAQAITAATEVERLSPEYRRPSNDASMSEKITLLAQQTHEARMVVEQACARLPHGNDGRRLWIMLGLLVIVVAWFLTMRWVMHG